MKLKELIAIIKELDDVRTPLKDALIKFTERIILRNNLESLNLPSIVENEGSIKAIIKHQGFYKDSFFFDPGECSILILPNNLTCGYVGNTLLVPMSASKKIKSNIYIDMNGSLFINCILVITYNSKLYTLRKRFNYLRIKALQF